MVENKRSGRPRVNWTRNNILKAWSFIHKIKHPREDYVVPPIDLTNPSHISQILSEATDYNAPFCTDNRESVKMRLHIGCVL